MNDERISFYKEIVNCLIQYGNLTPQAAAALFESSPVYQPDDDQRGLGILDHETPYYWAMHILYSKERPDWYRDPRLWPHPEDHAEK